MRMVTEPYTSSSRCDLFVNNFRGGVCTYKVAVSENVVDTSCIIPHKRPSARESYRTTTSPIRFDPSHVESSPNSTHSIPLRNTGRPLTTQQISSTRQATVPISRLSFYADARARCIRGGLDESIARRYNSLSRLHKKKSGQTGRRTCRWPKLGCTDPRCWECCDLPRVRFGPVIGHHH